MLEDVVRTTGLAAFVSSTAAIALRPTKPRYLIGSIIGIPTAIATARYVPEPVGEALTGGYIGGLVGYAAAALTRRSERAQGIASTIGMALGGTGAALIRYL